MKTHWYIGLSISLFVHFLILTGSGPFFQTKTPNKKHTVTKEIKITPEKIEKIKAMPKELIKNVHQPKALPYVEKVMDKLIEKRKLSTLKKPHFLERGLKEIILSEAPQDKNLKENPAYMEYYRLVREKVRASTFHNYDSNRQGEIFASFMVLKDGTLKNIEVNPKAAASKTLRKIALKSIKNAAPFPAFPQELKSYHYLRFVIPIYFKNK